MEFSPLRYDIPDAADAAHVGTTAIKTALREGELAYHKVGVRRLIMAEDLRAWVAAQAARGATRERVDRPRGANGKFLPAKKPAKKRRGHK